MKLFTILALIATSGCQSNAVHNAQESSGLRLPRNMSGNKPAKGRYLADSVYVSAAIKHTIARYKEISNIRSSDVSLFYPEVFPEQLNDFPMLAAHIEISKIEYKDHDLLDLVVVYLSKEGDLLHIQRSKFKEHNTKKHGAPW